MCLPKYLTAGFCGQHESATHESVTLENGYGQLATRLLKGSLLRHTAGSCPFVSERIRFRPCFVEPSEPVGKEAVIKQTSLRAMLWGLVPLFVIAHAGHHIVSALLTPLLPFIRNDFSLDYTLVGFLLSAFSLSYGFSQLPMVESYIITHASAEKRSTTLGIYFFGSRGGSGVIAPAIGFMVDRFGFNTSFAAVAVAIVIISLGFGFYMRKPRS